MADEENPQDAAAEQPEGGDAPAGAAAALLSKPKASWGLLKKSVITEDREPKQSDAFLRLVKQKAKEEGLAMPFAEALRKQELKTRRVSTMKFTQKDTYGEYKTRNAPTEKALMMERTRKDRPYVRGAADRGTAGVSFSKDPYAYLRTPNASPDVHLPSINGSPDRSRSISPSKMGGSSMLPSMKTRSNATRDAIMATRAASTSPNQMEFLRTPPGRWRETAGVPSIIKNNGNWCASWKFTKISSGYKPTATSMSPIPQRDPRVMEALAARMGDRGASLSPYKQPQFGSPGRQFNPMGSPKMPPMGNMASPDRNRDSRQQHR